MNMIPHRTNLALADSICANEFFKPIQTLHGLTYCDYCLKDPTKMKNMLS